MERIKASSSLFLRVALGLSFLSALADRFGLWGPFGRPDVSWGDFARFVAYTGQLNWFFPDAAIPSLAVTATCAEAALALCLLTGWHTQIAALLSGILLTSFGVTMTMALGVKAPLDFSVFSAAGGAFLLATCTEFPVSLDNMRRSRRIANGRSNGEATRIHGQGVQAESSEVTSTSYETSEQTARMTGGETAMDFPGRHAAKVLTGLVGAAGLALASASSCRAASPGEGATAKQILSQKLPNVPGKTLTVVQVDYPPGGFSAPHRHPVSGFVFAYVLWGAINSQVEGEPLRVYSAGQSWTEPPNAHHIVSANASKTEPARLIAYIVADDGAQATVYEK